MSPNQRAKGNESLSELYWNATGCQSRTKSSIFKCMARGGSSVVSVRADGESTWRELAASLLADSWRWAFPSLAPLWCSSSSLKLGLGNIFGCWIRAKFVIIRLARMRLKEPYRTALLRNPALMPPQAFMGPTSGPENFPS